MAEDLDMKADDSAMVNEILAELNDNSTKSTPPVPNNPTPTVYDPKPPSPLMSNMSNMSNTISNPLPFESTANSYESSE